MSSVRGAVAKGSISETLYEIVTSPSNASSLVARRFPPLSLLYRLQFRVSELHECGTASWLRTVFGEVLGRTTIETPMLLARSRIGSRGRSIDCRSRCNGHRRKRNRRVCRAIIASFTIALIGSRSASIGIRL